MLFAEVDNDGAIVVFVEEERRYGNLPGYLVLSRTEMDTYNIYERGVIRDPGKFYGEPYSVVLFFHSAMESGADEETGDSETTGYWWRFNITTDEERQQFHLDDDVIGVLLSEGSSGFVGMTWFTDQVLFDCTWEEIEAACSEDEYEETGATYWEVTFTGTPSDDQLEHVALQIKQGFTEGSL